MAVETQEAYCSIPILFLVYPPQNGVAKITTKDRRLADQILFLNTPLSDRQDIVTGTINSCNACHGNVSNCVLKSGGS